MPAETVATSGGLTDRQLVALLATTIIGRRTNGNASNSQISNAVQTARRILQEVENTEP